jgi:hypothetical protein
VVACALLAGEYAPEIQIAPGRPCVVQEAMADGPLDIQIRLTGAQSYRAGEIEQRLLVAVRTSKRLSAPEEKVPVFSIRQSLVVQCNSLVIATGAASRLTLIRVPQAD